jgi:hypothetical protein
LEGNGHLAARRKKLIFCRALTVCCFSSLWLKTNPPTQLNSNCLHVYI